MVCRHVHGEIQTELDHSLNAALIEEMIIIRIWPVHLTHQVRVTPVHAA
jgi:hypothetical protein